MELSFWEVPLALRPRMAPDIPKACLKGGGGVGREDEYKLMSYFALFKVLAQ